MSRYLTDLADARRGWHIPVGLFSALMVWISIQTWIEDSPADEVFSTWLWTHALVTAMMFLPLFFILRWHYRRYTARKIASGLDRCGWTRMPVSELDRELGISNCGRKIEVLKKSGFLQRVELKDGVLVLDAPERSRPEPAQKAVEAQPESVLDEIRRLNEAIEDEGVSRRVDRLEEVTAGILHTLEQRPDRADEARRFMNYYLPTTLKLLQSYDLMEDQSYQGQNIRAARRSIENVLDKLVAAAEAQQDKLFRSEAIDVEAEIRVLETMMASDGWSRETQK